MLVSKSLAGFTLIELMVTIAVGVILLTLAAPSFQDIIQNNRVTAQANDFVTALNLARSEAIKRGVSVTVCKSNDGTSCGGAGVNWQDGWIIFLDIDGDGTVDTADGDVILRTHEPLPTGYTLRSGSRIRVTYSAGGFSIGFNGTWTFCDPNKNLKRARGVIVVNTGRVRAAQDTNGDGIRDDGPPAPGNNLTCP